MPLPDGNPRWLHRPFTSLRPWGIAALILILLDGLLRLALPPDPRVLRYPLRAQACFADDALEALAEARSTTSATASSPAPWDIVLLGDSVLGSVNNPPGQRLHDYLDAELRRLGRSARVHNLSAGGAHAGDQYAALLRLQARLGSQALGLQRLLVVISVNPIFFSARHSQPPLSYPCVWDDLPDDLLDDLPPGTAPLTPDLRRRLGLSPPPAGWHRRLSAGLARGSYLVQQRRRLGEIVFGDHATLGDFLRAGLLRLRPPIRNASLVADQPWSARGLRADSYRASYDFLPVASPDALNAELTTQIARFLSTHRELAVLVEQVPQNHHMMDPLTGSDSYRALQQHLRDLFLTAGLPYRSHDRAPELRSEHFTDLDHLTAAGNAALAALLARDVHARIAELSIAASPSGH